MTPTVNKVRVGNGERCISHPEHGSAYVMPGGRSWCPHQSHDGWGTERRPGTSAWLDTQKKESEAS